MPKPRIPRLTAIGIQQLLAGYQASGQTRAAFCATHQLPVSTLNFYRRRPPTPAFVEINLPPSPPDFFAIVLRNGRRLELTWNALPHIAGQLEGLLLRLEA